MVKRLVENHIVRGSVARSDLQLKAAFPSSPLHRQYYTLPHTATHCNILQHTTTHCNTLQHTARHCNTLQHNATHCNTLPHTATQCHTLLQGGLTLSTTRRQRPIACLKLQVIFHKRDTNYRAFLQKMTYKDKASYLSSPPCNCREQLKVSSAPSLLHRSLRQ